MEGGKTGKDVAMTIGGQPQTLYVAPETDYALCDGYRNRLKADGVNSYGLTYYNKQGITYRGWVDGGDGKRLYQTVMTIDGQELYFIVWRAQYLPAGTDPVSGKAIPAGWYLFGDDGVLITKAGTYTYKGADNVDHKYEVNSKGEIVKVDGKKPAVPGAK